MQINAMFNKIIVLESIPDNELKTGKHLFEGVLLHANSAHPVLHSEYHVVDSADMMLSILGGIEREILENKAIPIIHVECHGCEDGLTMKDGSSLSWSQFEVLLSKLNLATRFNLLVVVGACSGAHLIDAAKSMDRAPFFGVVGPQSIVLAGELLAGFTDFYNVLFATNDIGLAIDAMNKHIAREPGKVVFAGARALFELAFERYYKTYCKGKGKRERIESLLSEAMKNPEVAKRGAKHTRDLIKRELSKTEKHFNDYRYRFFFADYIPNILDRFPLRFEDVAGKYA